MVNAIWGFMIITGIIAAAAQGKIDVITQAAFDGAKTGVTVSFGLISLLVLWLGLMKIAEDSGLLQKIAFLLRPVVKFLFPDVPKGHPAIGYILSNMTANLFGLGSAATPMGLKAMQELQKLNPEKDKASPAMCTLLAMNTSGLTIIPMTIIGYRVTYGSVNPAEIVGTTLFATIIATLVAVFFDRYFRNREQAKSGG